MKIGLTDRIEDILTRYPESYGVFLANGLKGSSAQELIESLGKDTLLRTVLNVKGINAELFIKMINERIAAEDSEYELYDPKLPPDMLVQTPCPTRMLFKERVAEVLRAYELEKGKKLNCFVVDGCGAPYEYQDIWKEDDIDKLPDIILSKGFDEFYNREFLEKFISTGKFESVLKKTKEEFSRIGCLDDDYTLSSAMVKVIMVDEKRLGDLPRPKAWKDLLDPIYEDQIVAFGTERGISKLTLHYIYKEFGNTGIEAFANNVKLIQHGAKMAKTAGTDSSETGAIYILPLTFARICEGSGLSVVWPEEGATILPMAILVKKDKAGELGSIIDFLLKDYGQMCVDINAISLNPDIENDVPSKTEFRWLGWDYIKSRDVFAIGNQLQEYFHSVWHKK